MRPGVGFSAGSGQFFAKTTPEFEYRRKARRLLNKHHTGRRRPNASHHRVLVWPEIPDPHLGIYSELRPLNTTRTLYERDAVA